MTHCSAISSWRTMRTPSSRRSIVGASPVCLVFNARGPAYTAARLQQWAGLMAQGAADVTSPATFFARMEAGADLAAPNGPCAWVDFGGPAGAARRVNLAQAQARSRAARAQGGLGLDAAGTGLPADGLSADGSWIDSLT